MHSPLNPYNMLHRYRISPWFLYLSPRKNRERQGANEHVGVIQILGFPRSPGLVVVGVRSYLLLSSCAWEILRKFTLREKNHGAVSYEIWRLSSWLFHRKFSWPWFKFWQNNMKQWKHESLRNPSLYHNISHQLLDWNPMCTSIMGKPNHALDAPSYINEVSGMISHGIQILTHQSNTEWKHFTQNHKIIES